MSKPRLETHFTYRENFAEGSWRWVLLEDLIIYFPDTNFGFHRFYDAQGHHWVSTNMHHFTIKKGYAWDGSSPKLRLGRKWLGTPDFQSTLIASCWHDASGQFRHLPCFKKVLSWSKWNWLFRELISHKLTANTYFTGLVLGNLPYVILGKLFGKKHTGFCVCHLQGK